MGYGVIEYLKRWPNGIIPFEIDEQAFPTGSLSRLLINNAIDEWNSKTILRLNPRLNNESDYAVFEPHGSACFVNNVGHRGGRQTVFCNLPLTLFAPPGGSVAMAKQTDHILTALAIDNNGALSVAWVTGTESWQGPVEITPQNLFPPGGSVAMAKQTDHILTALAIDNNGALSVAWVTGTESWQGPVEITPQNLFPSVQAQRSIAMAKQTDHILTALIINNNQRLSVSWVIGTESWQGPGQM